MVIEPKLRFKGFSGSWKRKSLGTLGTFKGGGTPESQNKKYWNGNIPWISSSDISEDNLHNIDISRKISDEAIRSSATKIIPKDSILFVSRVGVGKLAINSVDLCTSQDFVNFITKENILFIGYYNLANKKYLIRYSQGTSIKGITSDLISSLKINIPGDNAEQQKIASFLSSVDKKIELLTKKHKLLEKYKKGLMQKIFSQEIRFKQDDGKDFPDWDEKKLQDIVKINPKSKLGVNSASLNGRYLFFTSGKSILKSNEYLVDKKNIFMNDGGVADIKFYSGKAAYSDHTLSLSSKDTTFDVGYIYYFLNSKLREIEVKFFVGSGLKNLAKKDFIKTFNVFIPNSSYEQNKIASLLASVDKKIDLTKQQIEKTQTFKKGLLQQMFV